MTMGSRKVIPTYKINFPQPRGRPVNDPNHPANLHQASIQRQITREEQDKIQAYRADCESAHRQRVREQEREKMIARLRETLQERKREQEGGINTLFNVPQREIIGDYDDDVTINQNW